MEKFHLLPTKKWVDIEPQCHALLPEKCGIRGPALAPWRDKSK